MEENFLCLQISQDRPPGCIKHSECSVDLRLVDLKNGLRKTNESEITVANSTESDKIPDTNPSAECLARIEFSSRSKELSIESGSIDFISSVVRSLVIDYLGYGKFNSRLNIGGAVVDLNAKTLLAKQFEETDNKMLAEFSETSKNLRSLSEQLEMANDMFEL